MRTGIRNWAKSWTKSAIRRESGLLLEINRDARSLGALGLQQGLELGQG